MRSLLVWFSFAFALAFNTAVCQPVRMGAIASSITKSGFWYVGPASGEYGIENGRTLATAFDGFSDIDWNLILPGDIIYVFGTHQETMTIGASGSSVTQVPIYIVGLPGNNGIIDAQDTRATCINATNQTWIEFQDLTLIDATDSGLYLQNGTYVIRRVTSSGASGFGGQGFQNEVGTIATYYDCTGEGNIDDGLSLHVNAQVTAYTCIWRNNSQGVNGISTSRYTDYGSSFSGNTTSDLQPDSDADFQAFGSLFQSTATNTVSANSTVQTKVYYCVFTAGLAQGSVLGNLLAEDCKFIGTSGSQTGGTSTFKRCLIKSTRANTFATTGAGVIAMEYCVANTPSATTIFRHVSSGTFTIRNATITGTGSTAISCTVPGFTATNCIFFTLQNAASSIGATAVVTLNFCNINTVSVPTFTSSGGTINNTNAVSGAPLITSIGTDNYALQVGSSGIDTGTNTGIATGISTAVWGASSTIPTVTTRTQGAAYDLGAYIFN